MTARRLGAALARANQAPPPVWLMRQAGRYHAHYQKLRQRHSFEDLCKTPELAAEVALGPMQDFGFDAAILFSDILFPLEVLGQPLKFAPGPQFAFQLRSLADVQRLTVPAEGAARLKFQAEALRLTRARLRPAQGLIGFVGAPLTLYVFAVEGSHKHGIADAIQGLTDGRFEALMPKLLPLLADNILLQAEALAPGELDMLALFDSAAGEIPADLYENFYLPYLEDLLAEVKRRAPALPLLYYGKGLQPAQLELLVDLPLAALGIDHHLDLPVLFDQLGERFALQGNLDPAALTLPEAEFEAAAQAFFTRLQQVPRARRQGWICGLGHGVTPQAKEANVRRFVHLAQGLED